MSYGSSFHTKVIYQQFALQIFLLVLYHIENLCTCLTFGLHLFPAFDWQVWRPWRGIREHTQWLSQMVEQYSLSPSASDLRIVSSQSETVENQSKKSMQHYHFTFFKLILTLKSKSNGAILLANYCMQLKLWCLWQCIVWW